MLVKEFLDVVASEPDAPLLFTYDPGKTVLGGFHVTEIKNTTYETIDCGNSLHTWNEVIVQLWVPEDVADEAERMSAEKFRKIWDVVDTRIALDLDAEIRLEYGDAQTRTALYHVDAIASTPEGLEVTMAPQRTLCKPREILVDVNIASHEAEACCSADIETQEAPLRTETVLPLPTRSPQISQKCC